MSNRIPRYKTEDGCYLGIAEHRQVHTIGWFDPEEGDFGAMLNNLTSLDAEMETANTAVMRYCEDNGIQRPRNGADFEFESVRHARAAMRAANAALHYAAANKPMPDWAQKAAAAGWKPPKGWKP